MTQMKSLTELSVLRNYKRQLLKLLDEYNGIQDSVIRDQIELELKRTNNQIRLLLEE